MDQQIEFMYRGLQTLRYHTEVTLQRQSVGQHSAGVALLCDILMDGKASANLLRAALVHDLAEHRLGDMPAPAKRELNIRTVFQLAEDKLLDDHGLFVDQLSEHEQFVLSLADALDGLLWCTQERRLGNAGIFPVYMNFRGYAIELVNKHAPTGREARVVSVICGMWEAIR